MAPTPLPVAISYRMKILVFAHRFEVGGSQKNTIDLCLALRERFGYRPVIFATPGPMAKVAIENGLRFVAAPYSSRFPSVPMMRALRKVIHEERPDLIHVWDWWQCVDAYYAAHLLMRVPMVVSDMISEKVTRIHPKSLITTFGTPEFVDLARAMGRKHVELLVPPVDTVENSADAVRSTVFRNQHNITPDAVALVTVSRLVSHLKLESLRRTIEAIGEVGRKLPVRLLVAGDGPVRGELEQLGAGVNSALGREAVTFLGELLDPRPAYAGADIVVGMGGSALRGAAFEKPVIVVGAMGFAACIAPETASYFLYKGIYGVGSRSGHNNDLIECITSLAISKERRIELGKFARGFVVANFSIETVSSQLDRYFKTAISEKPTLLESFIDAVRMASILKFTRLTPSWFRNVIRKREQHQFSRISTRKTGTL